MSAGFTTYSDQASFLAAAGALTTQALDEFAGTYTFPNPTTFGNITLGSAIAGAFDYPPVSFTTRYLMPDKIGELTLAFGSPVVAAGIALFVADHLPIPWFPAPYSITVTDSGGSSTTTYNLPQGANFLGFVENSGSPGITQVSITPLPQVDLLINIGLTAVSWR